MSDAVMIALIATVPPTLVAAGGIVAAIVASMRTQSAIKEVHVRLDGRLDDMIEGAKAQGRQDERDDKSDVETKA